MSAPTLLARFFAGPGAPTQAGVAAAAGCSPALVSRLASGATEMTPARAARLALALARFGGPSAAALLIDQLGRLAAGSPSFGADSSSPAPDFPASRSAPEPGTGGEPDAACAARPGFSSASVET